jgi:hypothetical protein
MSQISPQEARDLLGKLLTERSPIHFFFATSSKARISLRGFVDSISERNGLAISESGPPIDTKRGWCNVRPFDRPCEFQYGEIREMPREVLENMEAPEYESVLMMRLPESLELALIFFTI